ncbi:hypothetical protein V1508DRAFT_428406 [Lipomyces doorenjongii]|uniref:uncharacterized protein n=1 Tax=Lipomyces doorenjongii TaxID=383834 RepID=UPI0034CFA56C
MLCSLESVYLINSLIDWWITHYFLNSLNIDYFMSLPYYVLFFLILRDMYCSILTHIRILFISIHIHRGYMA